MVNLDEEEIWYKNAISGNTFRRTVVLLGGYFLLLFGFYFATLLFDVVLRGFEFLRPQTSRMLGQFLVFLPAPISAINAILRGNLKGKFVASLVLGTSPGFAFVLLTWISVGLFGGGNGDAPLWALSIIFAFYGVAISLAVLLFGTTGRLLYLKMTST